MCFKTSIKQCFYLNIDIKSIILILDNWKHRQIIKCLALDYYFRPVMNCSDCGAAIPEGKIFCTTCGALSLQNIGMKEEDELTMEGPAPYIVWNFPYSLLGQSIMSRRQYRIGLVIKWAMIDAIAIFAILASQPVIAFTIVLFAAVFEAIWWKGGRKAAKNRPVEEGSDLLPSQ
jgi:hypothetical protein